MHGNFRTSFFYFMFVSWDKNDDCRYNKQLKFKGIYIFANLFQQNPSSTLVTIIFWKIPFLVEYLGTFFQRLYFPLHSNTGSRPQDIVLTIFRGGEEGSQSRIPADEKTIIPEFPTAEWTISLVPFVLIDFPVNFWDTKNDGKAKFCGLLPVVIYVKNDMDRMYLCQNISKSIKLEKKTQSSNMKLLII